MALTKVTGSVIKDSVSLSGNVSVGGTLTYQDVTNVDALGIGTFRTGIKVLAGQVDVGSNIKLGNAGVITATSFVGSGTNLTGIDTDLVSDSSPQLGGMLDSNGNNIKMSDSDIIVVGTGNDLQISHSSNISRLRGATTNDIHIESAANFKVRHQDTDGSNAEDMLICTGDGAVELYHNNTKTLSTSAQGATVTNGTSQAVLKVIGGESQRGTLELIADDGDDNADYWQFQARTDGNLNIQNYNGGSWVNSLILRGGGAAELYHNNSKMAETHDDGLVLNGLAQDTVAHGQYDNLVLGSTSGSAGLTIVSGSSSAGTVAWSDGSSGAGQYRGYLEYYHNTEIMDLAVNTGVAMRWATSYVECYEHFIPSADNSYNLGSTSKRWANIYTTDLQLSNEGKSNSVDGTWGNYTIQEGESDLFLINNRSGKKYKFNLTEVS